MQQSIACPDLLAAITRGLSEAPVLALLGTRQVGKTTLAKQTMSAWTGLSDIFDLEVSATWEALSRTPEKLLCESTGLVIFDEVQRMPKLFEVLRPICDDRNRVKEKIVILINNESWFLPYAQSLCCEIKKLGSECTIFRSPEELAAGWINFILGCVHILPAPILQQFKHNLVVHGSNLPAGKGFSPTTWQILEDKKTIPICLFEATEAVDAGDIWIRDTIMLDGTELHDEWRTLLSLKIIELCLRFINEHETLKPEKQTGKESFYPKRTGKDSELSVDKTIAEHFNLLRVANNQKYPAYFYINGHKYILSIRKSDSE